MGKMESSKNGDYQSDVVVSGISGRFPKSNNMNEFSHNLYNKIDMVDDDESRWKHFHPEVPKRTGKINNLEKFDASFFSIHNRLANATDPQARILLEHSYEAILDAGISPQSIAGSRTGVFIGCSMSDSKDQFLFKIPTKDGHALLGNANFYIANRISYALDLCGPSITVDTACSSSGTALELAYKNLQDGTCDAALVGGSQVVLNIVTTTGYHKIRVLADDGYSRPYDKEASGFVRAETICVLFLQKEKDSKRVYARLLHVNCNNDGYKPEGSTYPSRFKQQQLSEECYAKINLDPNLVGYLEAHSTGTLIGDAEEVAGVDEAYCKNRPKPLLIGSLKSNMGHAEASSAVASIAKVLLVLENQKIPPNINLKELRDDIPAFAEGRIKVVREVEPLESPYVALNSFGLGGANTHAIFKGNGKTKVNFGIPKDGLNRLIFWSGRTEVSVNTIFDDITTRPLDAEHIALLQNSQIKTTLSNIYRGYGIFAQNESSQKAICIQRNIKHFNSSRKPIVWVYSGIGSQWLEMGRDLMKIPVCAKTIDFCHRVLLRKGLNLKEIITSKDKTVFENVLHSYVGIIAIEIALTDLLKSIGMKPDFIIGHSVGELGCSYCDGCFTAEETILVAHARGVASNTSKNIAGGMAAIGMNHKEVHAMLPADIDIACHNSSDSTTLSGPVESVKAFVDKLTSENIFAREVASSGLALHSRYIKEMGATLNGMLKEIIKTPKKRSAKWLSSTYPADQWSHEESQFSSAEYHTKNLLSPVLFQEAFEQLPDCLTIEIAPHGLLKPLLKRSLKESVHFSITQRGEEDGVSFLMNTLGQIFQNGIDLDISKLYPKVSFPVSRGTPMISPMIKWDHSLDLFVPKFSSSDYSEKKNVLINISDKEFEFVQGHVIDGKILFPGTGLVVLVWETFGNMLGLPFEKIPVTFDDVKFLRATSLQKNRDVILSINIQKVSGMFEITEGQSLVAVGRVRINDDDHMSPINAPKHENSFKVLEEDFYKEMRLRGYHHKDQFRAVIEARDDGLEGKIKWTRNWTTFTDCLLQLQVLMRDTRMLVLPTKFRKMVINPAIHEQILSQSTDETFDAVICPYTNIIRAGGVEIHDFEGNAVNRRRMAADPVLEEYKFIPHTPSTPQMLNIDMAKFCIQLLLETVQVSKVITVEVDSNDDKELLSEFLFHGITDLPMITSEINYLTTREIEVENVNIDSKELKEFENVSIIVKSKCANDVDFLVIAEKSLQSGGMIVSRESLDTKLPISVAENFQMIAAIPTETELIVLMQLAKAEYVQPEKVLKITSNVEEWLEPLKEAVNSASVLIYSQNDNASGIIGLFHCVRKELSPETRFICVLIEDKAPIFDANLPFYKNQLQQGFAVNVFKNGCWGSYRHLRINDNIEKKSRSDHCYLNCLIKGDMSSLNWFEGNLCPEADKLVRIKYSALNFRDVMQASGKLSFEYLNRIQEQSYLGFEFSGVKSNGKRVMGLGVSASFSTHFKEDESILWDIPDSWSLEDAATVPLVYCTVMVAFHVSTKVQRGKSILIHAGSGGVGLAALHIAFHYGLEVFTTVSTEEKKKYLLNEFPQLKEENIGNSRDISFENMIKVNTKGKGVDYVLNSLSDDKLFASLRCLGDNGVFLEIGRYDILNKSKIDMGFLAKNIKMEAIMILSNRGYVIEMIYDLIQDHLDKGIIKPLKTTVFEANEVQTGFRFLASGKHIGKVLIKMRENEDDLQSLPMCVKKQVFFDSSLSYIVVGGMGGFGLEMADWMVLKGCKYLVISSSRGITNGYQKSRLRNWKSYGVSVVVSTADVTTEKGCKELIKEAIKLKPVGGIFNLAVALRDGIFENQTVQMFKESLAPKALATKFLDTISQQLCPELKHFVIFSSVSCGRGNAGQSNYGLANSIMERIIESRHERNLPAKAIQWGAIGDVGLLAELQEKNMDMTIGGSLPQRISSCIEVLDTLLTINAPVVASMVVAEKKVYEFKKDNVIEAMFNILGIQDKKSISMDSPLSKLGLDSLMTVEITQLLEREFNLFLTAKQLQTMTLYDLDQRTKGKDTRSKDVQVHQQHTNLELILRNIVREQANDNIVVCLKKGSTDQSKKLLLIPGIEGVSGDVWIKLAESFKLDTYALQLNKFPDAKSFADIHNFIIQDIIKLYAESKNFLIVGHSFGALLSLRIAKTLEARGLTGKIVMIDGSPLYFKRFTETLGPADTPNEVLQNEILKSLIRMDFPETYEEIYKSVLMGANKESLESFISFYHSNKSIEKKYSKSLIVGVFNRMKMIRLLDEDDFPTLESTQISIIAPTDKFVKEMPGDYNLQRYSSEAIMTLVVNGNHLSILQTEELSSYVNGLN